MEVIVCIFESFVYDLGILDPVKFCDFTQLAFDCEHHDMGYKEIDCNFYKSIFHQSFCPCFQNMSHNSQILCSWQIQLVSTIMQVTVTVFIFDSVV